MTIRALAAAALILTMMASGCSSADAPDRAPTGGALDAVGSSPSGATGSGARLMGEFIGRFDPVTKTLTIAPATGRNDALGLTGQATWALAANGLIRVSTLGAKYVDSSGVSTMQGAQGNLTACPTAPTGTCDGVACATLTCASIAVQTTTGATLTNVDLEVSGLSTIAAVVSDDTGNRSASEKGFGIGGSGLGVWQFSSVTGSPTTGATLWQIGSSTIGQAWEFGVRAWDTSATAVLTFGSSTQTIPTTAQPNAHAGTAVTLTNSGSAPTSGSGGLVLTTTGSSAITLGGNSCTGATLAATSGHCAITPQLSCAGPFVGLQTTTFMFSDTGTGGTGAAASITVSGTCTSRVALQFSATTEDVCASGGTCPSGSTTNGALLTLTSTGLVGTGALTGPVITGSSAFAFSIPDGCAGASLGPTGFPTDKCTVTPTLTCTHATLGPQSAIATFTDSSTGVSASVALTGTCVTSSGTGWLVMTPTTIDFGGTVAGTNVTSASAATLVNYDTKKTKQLSAVTSGSSALTFTGCSLATLSVLQTCTVGATLDCTGITAGTSVSATYTLTDPTALGGTGASASLTATGYCSSVVGVSLSISPTTTSASPQVISPAYYGTGATGAPSTITNSGSTATGTIGAAVITGADAALFSVNQCAGSLASGASCIVVPTLTCTAAKSGARSATATFTDPASGASVTLYLSGTCISPLEISPTSETFAAQPFGGTAVGSPVTISNVGPVATAGLSGPAVVGHFGVSTDGCAGSPLAANTGTCTFTPEMFCGATTGAQVGSVTYTDASSGATAVIALSGYCGELTVSPATESITGYYGIGVAGANVTFTNHASVASSATPSMVTGTYAGIVAFPTCSTISAGGTCIVQPVLTCATASPASGQAVATYSDPNGGIVTVTVNGTCANALSTSVPSLSLGTEYIGYSASPVGTANLLNAAPSGIVVGAPTVVSAHPSYFTFANCGTVVSGTPCAIKPQLTCPTTATAGAVTATATYADGNGNTATLSVSGTCAVAVTFPSGNPQSVGTNLSEGPAHIFVLQLHDNDPVDAVTLTGSPAGVLTNTTGNATWSIGAPTPSTTIAASGTASAVSSVTCTGSGAVSTNVVYTDGKGLTYTVKLTATCM